MPLLDVNEAARLAGRHPETVRRWVWTGRLRAERRGRKLMVEASAVQLLAGAGTAARAGDLAAWAQRAAAHQQATERRGGRSAADLVLEDRRARSG